MTAMCLYDAVTLRHFGATARLDVLEARCKYLDPPYWTQAVRDEIQDAVNSPGCQEILAAGWLSSPLAPRPAERRKILAIQLGLNEGRHPPEAHVGEAESIYFAAKLDGRFVTDDNGAYDFATQRLGPGRVFDTIDLLREAVTNGDMKDDEALNLVDAIRNCGRSLRRLHPDPLPRGYFR